MKTKTVKTMLLALLLFLGFALTEQAQAQTKEETIAWLKVKARLNRASNSWGSDFASKTYFTEEYLEIPYSINEYGLVRSTGKINYNAIQSVTLTGTTIVLTGHTVFTEDRGRFEGIKTLDKNSCSLYFTDKADNEELMKIVKALKHLATISGAKLVDDDLF